MNSLAYKVALGATLATAALAAAPASAATIEVAGTGCSTAPITPSADKCAGYYDNNQFSNSGDNVALQQRAINALLGNSSYTVDFNALKLDGKVVSGADLTALANLLASAGGQVILGLHWGNVPESGTVNYGNVSAFYLWNNVATGSIQLTNPQGYSNAVLYRATAAAVPEPATWALMLLGFGGMGVAMRRRRAPVALPQMA